MLTNYDDYAGIFAVGNTVVERLLGVEPRGWAVRLEALQTDHDREHRGRQALFETRPAEPLPPLDPVAYVGQYEHPIYGGVVIESDDGMLRLRRGNLRGALEHWDRDSFLVTYPSTSYIYDIITFTIGNDRIPISLRFFDEPGFVRVGRGATGH